MTSAMFLSMLVLVAFNIPLALSIAFACIVAFVFFADMPTFVTVQRMFTGIDSFPLMSIPFFLLAGKIMEKGGVSIRLVNLGASIVGSTPGGLAIIALLASMFFASISGSAPATVVAIGSIMVPAMIKAGYDKGFSVALMAVGGTIGIIIPPSIPFVVYGISANVSIGDLFIAGIVPGLIVGFSLIIYSYYYSKSRGFRGSEPTSFANFISCLKKSLFGLAMPVIILGGIYSGFFTPTESGAIACVYGLVISVFIYKELSFSDLKEVFVSSGLTSSMVLLIIGAANIMGWILTTEQFPQQVSNWISSVGADKIWLLLAINAVLLLIGTFLELNAAIILLVPIFLPILINEDVNLINFGVIMITNLAIGLLTPPLGVNLFVAKSLSDTSFSLVVRKVFPLLLVMIIDLLLFTFLPYISLFFIS
ncbi:MAG: TRAP transporter large permease [Gammaproteobacteria bacterium]|nr:TRAP transporter large permease [Gammaproteobacteria bacterium]MBU1468555.1 TRAP transporter large permease [Gammaproteobacteria bacterium]MBU2021264.1 TRAP transporter large permease [Gammaproteobacteria bacterium]MBU2238753.1 TRAP transporter large permease [Gammaproteobacteria bacterium]MBU2320850.1 TRAP transporter large permease [Gammaproteobacteria bacterium]